MSDKSTIFNNNNSYEVKITFKKGHLLHYIHVHVYASKTVTTIAKEHWRNSRRCKTLNKFSVENQNIFDEKKIKIDNFFLLNSQICILNSFSAANSETAYSV